MVLLPPGDKSSNTNLVGRSPKMLCNIFLVKIKKIILDNNPRVKSTNQQTTIDHLDQVSAEVVITKEGSIQSSQLKDKK